MQSYFRLLVRPISRALVFLLLLWQPVCAYAQITISEDIGMDFAVVAIPSSGSEYIEIPRDGGAETGTGTVVSGITSRGEYTITGTGSTTISIDIDSVSTGSSEITLDNFRGVYNNSVNIDSFPATGLANPTSGGKPLYLGARLTYTSSISDGSNFSPQFDIVVNYE